MNAISSSRSIPWRQIWSLAAMLSSIVLGFTIYNIFQPQILATIGFSHLANNLGIAQGLLGAVVEPAVGSLSDAIVTRIGSRLPQITIGVTVASLVFVVTALLVPIDLPLGWNWLFLLLMFIWVMAMIAIRGPIVAILRQITPISQLPIANTVIILSISLVGAIGPLLTELLKSWGSSIALVLGAIFLVIGATLLHNNLPIHYERPIDNTPQRGLVAWALMALIGCAAGIEVNTVLQLVPPFLQQQWNQLTVGVISALLLGIAAIAGVGLGSFCQRWGAARAMQVGLVALVLMVGLFVQPWISGLMWLGCGVAMGLVFISAAPLALSYVGWQQAGLSTGLFFGGSGLGSSLILYLVRQYGLNLYSGWILMLVTMAIAILSLSYFQRLSPAN
jgi:MFS family permease